MEIWFTRKIKKITSKIYLEVKNIEWDTALRSQPKKRKANLYPENPYTIN